MQALPETCDVAYTKRRTFQGSLECYQGIFKSGISNFTGRTENATCQQYETVQPTMILLPQ